MKFESIYLPSTSLDKLHILNWESPTNPVALLVYTHGYAGHAERYRNLAEAAFESNIKCIGMDLRGHGRSQGDRAYVARFDHYIDDYSALVSYAVKSHFHLPLFLFGHSMGALVTVKYALDKSPSTSGILLSGLAIHVTDSVSPILVKLSKYISAIFPKLPAQKLQAKLTAKNDTSVQRYVDDPMIYHGGIKARTGYEFMMAGENVGSRASEFTYPTILFHGDDDGLSNKNGSVEFYDNCSSTDKTLRILPGLGHEILNELTASDTLEEMMTWIKKRV